MERRAVQRSLAEKVIDGVHVRAAIQERANKVETTFGGSRMQHCHPMVKPFVDLAAFREPAP